MKKLAAVLCFAALTCGAFAQGTVTMFNTTSTLISSGGAVIPAGAPGTYYFGLLSAPLGVTDLGQFSFTGVYGTNLTQAGVVFGGANRVTTGWGIGEDRNYYLAGWSADNGPTWQAAWLTGLPTAGFFGRSAIAHGVAGGAPPSGGFIPALNLFGGAPSLTTGFNLVPVPEPTTMALAGLGAAALLIFRRRK
jgi:hypothetical protein